MILILILYILQLYSNVNWDYPKVSSDYRLTDQTDEESEQLFRKTYLFLFKGYVLVYTLGSQYWKV